MKRIISSVLIAMQLLSCCAISAFAEKEFVNVSINRVSSASSSSEEHGAYYANDGINDNAENTWWQSSAEDKNAYWDIDLGVEYQISKIEYQPRIEAPADECASFEIIASCDKTFDTYSVLVSQSDAVAGNTEYVITDTNRYRYVRARKTDGGVFSIGELNLYSVRESISQGATVASAVLMSYLDTDEARRFIAPDDVVGTKYENAVWLLCQLNLMRGYEDGSFKPENRITRAEFAAIVARIFGSQAEYSTQTFTDVPKGHWAYNYIEQCAAYGIVNGVSKTEFAPDKIISTTEAMKVFVTLVGYGVNAERAGGWPDGYRLVAGELGFYGDISSGEEITRGEIASVLLEVIDTDIIKLDYSNGKPQLLETKNETVLTSYQDIVKSSGIITASGLTSLTETFARDRNTYVEIDGVPYSTDIPWISEYLGYKVDFYYSTEDKDDLKVVAVVPKKNDVLVIKADEDTTASGNTIYYYEDGSSKKKNETVTGTIDVIYNGTAYADNYTLSDIIPTSGQIKLIDNDTDNEWDVMVIVSEETYVVSWASVSDEKIYVKNSTVPLTFDMDNDVVEIIDGQTGAAMSLSDIAEWNVITVTSNHTRDGVSVTTIVVSTRSERGTVDGKSGNIVTLNDAEYKVADSIDIDNIEVGDTGTFYIDYKGRIAGFNDKDYTAEQYGYIKAILHDANNEEILMLRMFTEEGVFYTYTIDDKVKIDGTPYDDAANIKTHLSNYSDNAKGAQIVKYKLNQKNEVTYIDTIYKDATKETDDTLTLDFQAAGLYYMNSGIVGMQFAKDEKTVMMRIPGDLGDEESYEVLPAYYLENSTTYSFDAYDGGDMDIMGLFVFRETSGDTTSIKDSAPIFIVDEITRSVNEAGDVKSCVSGLYKGEYVSLFEYNDGIINSANLQFGDIITLSLSSKNEIKAIEKRFYGNAAKPTDAARAISIAEPQTATTAYSNIYHGYGTVVAKENVFAKVSFTTTTPYEQLLINLDHDLLKIYVIDSVEEELRIGTKADVVDVNTVGQTDASRVFVTGRQGNIHEMVIFK